MVVQLDFYWQSKFNESLWFWPFCCVTLGLQALGCRGKVYNMELEMGPLTTSSRFTEGRSWPQLTSDQKEKGKTILEQVQITMDSRCTHTLSESCQHNDAETNRSNSSTHSHKQPRQIVECQHSTGWRKIQVILASTWRPVVVLVQLIFYSSFGSTSAAQRPVTETTARKVKPQHLTTDTSLKGSTHSNNISISILTSCSG